jgi:hypothetical protein
MTVDRLSVMALGSCLFAAEAQTFSVYELNEFDRDSPAFLEFSRQTVTRWIPTQGRMFMPWVIKSLSLTRWVLVATTICRAHIYISSTLIQLLMALGTSEVPDMRISMLFLEP